MSLQQLTSIVAPASTLRLDTSSHIHATDGKGNVVISSVTGEPITIAQDLISGKWYAKVAESLPFFGTNKSALQPLIDAGAQHVAHADERWRGVWAPIPLENVS